MGLRVGFIGTGDPAEESADGFAMAYRHASAYERLDDCELVACADIIEENANAFAREFDISRKHVYEDAERMLAEAVPDVVSICVPPAVHADLVIACAKSDAVDAVHCEKPMASTWEECREMVRQCEDRDTQLTINHQRRFAKPFRRAKELLDEGRTGDLDRIEIGGQNLYDYGSHLFDMCGFFTDQAEAEWVLGQVAYQQSNVQFGMHNENQGLARWRYENGVNGLASTGEAGLIDCQIRLRGESGTIEVGPDDGPPLRVRTDGSGWEHVDTGQDGIYGLRPGRNAAAGDAILERLPVGPDQYFRDVSYVDRAIEDVVESLHTGRESEISGRKALQATELIFATWESARRSGLVELPLKIADNPLEAMVDNGTLRPV
jgi:predicted dehydrogenase